MTQPLIKTEPQPQCSSCHQLYPSETDLRIHEVYCTAPAIQPRCSICNACFNSPLTLASHMADHTLQWDCALCGKRLMDGSMREEHLRVSHGVATSAEDLSEAVPAFSQQVDPQSAMDEFLDKTRKVHDAVFDSQKKPYVPPAKVRKYNCTKCDKSYGKRSHLRRHINDKHNRADGYACQVCQRVYRTQHSIKDHMKRTHLIELAKSESITGQPTLESSPTKPSGEDKPDSKVEDVPETGYSTIEELYEYTRSAYVALPVRRETAPRAEDFEEPAGIDPVSVDEFPCAGCSSLFSTEDELLTHLCVPKQSEDSSKPYTCIECGYGFITSSKLKRHQVTHITQRLFQCELCRKSFRCMKDVENHKMRVHNDGVPASPPALFQCNVCLKYYKSADTLRKHECNEKDRKPRPYPCPICERTFQTADTAARHITTHSEQRPFVCLYCKETFKRKDTVKNHISFMHANDPPLQICSMRVVEPEASDPPSVETRFQCLDCALLFAAEDELRTHECTGIWPKAMKQKKRSPFACDKCEDSFEKSEDMKRHSQTHSSDRPFMCVYCEKRFKRKDTAKEHVHVMHKNEPLRDVIVKRVIPEGSKQGILLKCTTCELRFPVAEIRKHDCKGKPGLERVEVTQQFPCPLCWTIFDDMQSVKSHMVVHSDEPEIKCTQCGLLFPKQTKLDEHVADVHKKPQIVAMKHIQKIEIVKPSSAEEILKCDSCGVVCDTEEEFDNHECKESKTLQRHPCPVCLKIFFDELSVKHHMKSHRDEPDQVNETSNHTEADVSQNQCPTCNICFGSDSELQTHNCTDTKGKKMFPCPVCPKIFVNVDVVRSHVVSHSESQSFVCKLCDHTFNSSSHLSKHIQSVHKADTLKQKPSEAELGPANNEEESSDSALLVSSLKASDSESEHSEPTVAKAPRRTLGEIEIRRECPVCYKPFAPTAEEELGAHMSSEHNYRSKLSDLAIRSSDRAETTSNTPSDVSTAGTSREDASLAVSVTEWFLVDGLVSADAQSRHVCPHCFRSYKYYKGVRRHLLDCPVRQPAFLCEKCGKPFKTLESLDTHAKRHTGDYYCTFCKSQFIEKQFVRRHVRRRHKLELAGCTEEEVAKALYKDGWDREAENCA